MTTQIHRQFSEIDVSAHESSLNVRQGLGVGTILVSNVLEIEDLSKRGDAVFTGARPGSWDGSEAGWVCYVVAVG